MHFELPAAALFEGQRATYEQLFAFLGVKCPSDERLEHVLGKRLNAQDHYDGGAELEWTEAQREAARPLVQEVAEKLGYKV